MYRQQECIPVGCVPSAAVAVSPGGVFASVHAGIPTPGSSPPGPGTPHYQASPKSRHPSCGQTDACETITFATSLRTVNSHHGTTTFTMPCQTHHKQISACPTIGSHYGDIKDTGQQHQGWGV